jgi:hypothetical protein
VVRGEPRLENNSPMPRMPIIAVAAIEPKRRISGRKPPP